MEHRRRAESSATHVLARWVAAIGAVVWLAAVLASPALAAKRDATGGPADFVYLEPVRSRGTVTFVVRWVGRPPSDGSIRVELLADGRKREVLYGAEDDAGQSLPAGLEDRGVPRADERGRPWPLVFADPPPANARTYDYRVELSSGDLLAVQRITIDPVGDQWKTTSKRLKLPRGAGTLSVPATFLEAQDQGPPRSAPRAVERPGAIAAPEPPPVPPLPAAEPAPASAESEPPSQFRGPQMTALAAGVVLVGGALWWLRRNRHRFGPSPEQRGAEGAGLLVMLALVLAASGALIVRHFVER